VADGPRLGVSAGGPDAPLAPDPRAAAELARLDELVRILRARCPWDREQTHLSLAPYLLEEAYETVDAIENLASSGSSAPAELVDHLREELGDVLIQVFLHSVLAEEEGRFTLAEVTRNIHDKLVRRHPHVFGDAVAETPGDVAERWEVLKKAEKPERSVPGGIPEAVPALTLVSKLLRKAESVGMSVPSVEERLTAGRESLTRLASADSPDEPAPPGDAAAADQQAEAVGELLLAAADLARRVGVDPEMALRSQARRLRQFLEAAGAEAEDVSAGT